jgi:hypothetical protein
LQTATVKKNFSVHFSVAQLKVSVYRQFIVAPDGEQSPVTGFPATIEAGVNGMSGESHAGPVVYGATAVTE